jgi:hypothetical protein
MVNYFRLKFRKSLKASSTTHEEDKAAMSPTMAA